MEYRRLGRTNLKVSALGLGCNRFGAPTPAGSDEGALRVIGCALDAGINFFDTADVYGQGASETLLGRALRGRRDQVVVATKAGFCPPLPRQVVWGRIKACARKFIPGRQAGSGSGPKAAPLWTSSGRQDFSSPYLERRLDASLRRLGFEAVDVFLLHSPPVEVLKRGEVFEKLESLRRQGKLRHYGVSCESTADTELCLRHPGVSVVQTELNLFTPEVVARGLPALAAQDTGVVARQALARGLVFRHAPELRPEHCAPRPAAYEAIKARLDRLEKLALQAGRPLAHCGLQFLLQQKAVSTVILGTTKPEHLLAHVAVLECPPLPPELLAAFGDAPGGGGARQ